MTMRLFAMNLLTNKNNTPLQVLGSQMLACRTLASRALACSVALMASAAPAQGTPEQGFRLMAVGSAGNCLACHAWAGQPGIASNFGPALDKVGTRYSAAELRQWVTDGRVFKPATLMPPFGTTQGTNLPIVSQPLLSFEDIGHVVAALQTLR